MASNAAEEQQYIDGTHPALAGNAPVRSTSPVRSRSVSPVSSSSRSSSPRFKTVDSDPPSSNTTPMPALNPPTRNGGASNTGPKGVLADFKASRTGGASNTGPKGVLADWKGNEASKAGRGTLHSAVRGVRVISLDDHEDGEASGEGTQSGGRTAAGEEGEAIEKYRRKRMQELSGSGERSGKGKMFGHLREIGVDQFLSAIDDEHPDVAVVLHLYEPHIEACAILDHHLSSIAREFPHTKFIRALATDVDFAADSEDETLPTVLIYRGGELESTVVRFDHEWGTGAREEIVELLRKKNAIPEASFGSRREDVDSGDSD